MDPTRWQAIEALFTEVAELPASERNARLAAAPAHVRAAVERLLLADSEAGSFIRVAIADGEALLAAAPQHFGPWKVESVLGHGGMASVFKVVRDDGAFRQTAALKTLQFGKDSPEARARFRMERQFLATLEHPGIARLIDGGEAPNGQPYIVMEFVEGEPLIAYAERSKLSREQRLRLFLEVCAAVGHAHQALIAHRDLKPSNILVTPAGRPKLLDFGIARLIDDDAPATANVALTPRYASPEQLRRAPVTTATDIYSLGLILHELLTGRPTPSAPSNLPADLGAVLQMALRDEPQFRYATAGDFAADIERVLTHHPVRALPPTWPSRLSHFLRRNWLATTAAVLLLTTLLGGLAASQYQARRADRRFEQVRKLANRFLFDFDAAIAPVSGTTKARELLVSTAIEYLDNLAAEAAGDASLQAELAAGYEKLGDVQGRPSQPSLGRYADALKSYQRAASLGEAALAAGQSGAPIHRTLASATAKIGELLTWTGKPAEAPAALSRAAAYANRAIQLAPADNDARFLSASISYRLGDAYANAASFDAAVTAHRDALAGFRALAAANPTARNKNGVSLTLARIAANLFRTGDLSGAKSHYEEAVALSREMAGAQPPLTNAHRSLAGNLEQLGAVLGLPDLTNLGEFARAEAILREAATLREAFAAADPNDRNSRHSLVLVRYQLASVVLASQPAEALRLARSARAAAEGEQTMTNVAEHLNRARFIEAQALTALGDHAAALRLLATFGDRELNVPNPPISRLAVALARAASLRATGQSEPARRELTAALQPADAKPNADRTFRDLRQAAAAHHQLAELDPATRAAHKAAEEAIWTEWRRRGGPAWYLPKHPTP